MIQKNTTKIILTDIDGVILDFGQTFLKFLEEVKGEVTTVEDYFRGKREIPLEEHQRIVAEYTHSDYFRHLNPKLCALDVLNGLRKEGWRFIAVTACDTEHPDQCIKTAYNNRMENLERHFPDVFEDMHFSPWSTGKKEILSRYQPTWWIDDRADHAHDGHDAGHKAIIMRGEDTHIDANNHANLPIVETWHEIKALIDADVSSKTHVA